MKRRRISGGTPAGQAAAPAQLQVELLQRLDVVVDERDRHHDDVADANIEVRLTGWGIQDRHETLNSLNWGPDGWLYGCHGVFTHSNVGKPGAPDSERMPRAMWPKPHTMASR